MEVACPCAVSLFKGTQEQGDPRLQIRDAIEEGPVEDQGDALLRRSAGAAGGCHCGGGRLGALLVDRKLRGVDHLGEVIALLVVPQTGEVGLAREKGVLQPQDGQNVLQISLPFCLKLGQAQVEEQGVLPPGQQGGELIPLQAGQPAVQISLREKGKEAQPSVVVGQYHAPGDRGGWKSPCSENPWTSHCRPHR